MTRPRVTLTVLGCLLALAACGASHPTRPGAVPRAPAPPRVSTIGETAAASLFAGAYVRFLDGAGTANALPDAIVTVRALAGRAGPIPPSRRRGTLVMSELRPATGAAGSYLLAARDVAHTFYALLTVGERHGRWLVVQLTPPDFVQVLAPSGPLPSAAPAGSAAAQDAARRFLRGYLPWLYGHGPLHAISSATSRLLADLETHPPRVPPTMRSLRPRVAAIEMQRHGHGWQALPNVTDGRETYELTLTVTHTHGRWLVSALTSTP